MNALYDKFVTTLSYIQKTTSERKLFRKRPKQVFYADKQLRSNGLLRQRGLMRGGELKKAMKL